MRRLARLFSILCLAAILGAGAALWLRPPAPPIDQPTTGPETPLCGLLDRRNDRSACHLSLGLDYPQPDDLTRARAAGYSPGGDIMIQSQPNAVPNSFVVPGDWTAGCIALTNAKMREIWAHAPIGTKVEIRP